VKQFHCGDIVTGCDRSFCAESEDGILQLVGAHALADHGITEITSELVLAVRANIHRAAV
jgi:predicted small metal-binding protein